MLKRRKIPLFLLFILPLITLLLFPQSGRSNWNPASNQPNMQSIFLPLMRNDNPPPAWLNYLNSYRAMAKLPEVYQDKALSNGDWLHARYIVKNDILQGLEDSANPWYSKEGDDAAHNSNLAGSFDVNATDQWAIDTWMQAPFHAVGILDPHLIQVGYGSYREADGLFQMGAALDVLRGRTRVPSTDIFPIEWPGSGAVVGLTIHWGEQPNPLSSCPGYSVPSGLPVILQIGPGDQIPHVTSHSFKTGTTELDHCVFDETSYVNSDSSSQSIGRSILKTHDAIILIPRSPLKAGTAYTVSITSNGQVYTWSFSVSDKAKAVQHEAGMVITPPTK